jgi:hypothetical protein
MTGDTGLEQVLIFKSNDGAASWWPISPDPGGGIEVRRNDPSHVMATGGTYLRLTTDAGETWFVRPTGAFYPVRLVSPPWSPGSFYSLGTQGPEAPYGVWRTEDFGDTWFPCGEGLPEPPGTVRIWTTFIEAHPSQPTLFAALDGRGVWRFDLAASGFADRRDEDAPSRLSIAPNPSWDRFTVDLSLPRSGPVSLRLFDTSGRLIETLKDSPLDRGTHTFTWRRSDQRSRNATKGIYYLRLDQGNLHRTQKIVMME